MGPTLKSLYIFIDKCFFPVEIICFSGKSSSQNSDNLYTHNIEASVSPYLFVSFEDVALEDISRAVSSDVAPDLQVLGVVGHVEYPKIG